MPATHATLDFALGWALGIVFRELSARSEYKVASKGLGKMLATRKFLLERPFFRLVPAKLLR